MAATDAGITKKSDPRKAGRAFHRPSKAIQSRIKSIAATKGFAEPDVLLRWPEAVGPALSGICQPVKVTYGGAMGATLIVRTDGAHAPEVEHRAPQIVERINSFYGYRAISRLRITQATGMRGMRQGFSEDRAGFSGAPDQTPQPASSAALRAAELASDVRDPDLRKALTLMGSWVLSQPPRTK